MFYIETNNDDENNNDNNDNNNNNDNNSGLFTIIPRDGCLLVKTYYFNRRWF